MAILLGTVLGGALGSLGESFLNDLARDAIRSRDRWDMSPMLLRVLDWLPLLNPCAHIGAALGCVLAWRRTGGGIEGRAEGPGSTDAPGRRRALGPAGTRVVLLTIGGSLIWSFLGLLWGAAFGSRFPFLVGGGDEGPAEGLFLGSYFGPPFGALLGCWVALRGPGGLHSPPAGVSGWRKFLGPRFSTPAGALVVWSGLAFVLAMCPGGIVSGTILIHRPSANFTTAIATLRNLASCQAQTQNGSYIDCDGDGNGEYGTFLEMTGSVPVRKGFFPGSPAGSDFSALGKKLNPPVVSVALADVDARGIVRKSGYCFIIYLPDTSRVAGFVHETGPAATPGLSGRVGVDLSETAWCAYAWPATYGTSGTRAFFVNQSGDVMGSSNRVAKWSGTERPMAPDSAFLGSGITSPVAVDAVGRNGNFWRPIK